MAGGSVRAENIKEIIKESGVVAVHSRATDNHVFKSLQGALREVAPSPLSVPFTKPIIPESILNPPQPVAIIEEQDDWAQPVDVIGKRKSRSPSVEEEDDKSL